MNTSQRDEIVRLDIGVGPHIFYQLRAILLKMDARLSVLEMLLDEIKRGQDV